MKHILMALFTLFSAFAYMSTASAAQGAVTLESALQMVGNPTLTQDEAGLAVEISYSHAYVKRSGD